MSDQRVEEIRERWEKATDGPWRACTWDPMERPHVHRDEPDENYCEGRNDIPRSKADAEAIAHAPSDIRYLLDLVRRQREVVEIVSLWLDADWQGLIEWAERHDCLPDRAFAGEASEYKWAGDHETDARHTYPMRDRLLTSCLRHALDKLEDKSDHPRMEKNHDPQDR